MHSSTDGVSRLDTNTPWSLGYLRAEPQAVAHHVGLWYRLKRLSGTYIHIATDNHGVHVVGRAAHYLVVKGVSAATEDSARVSVRAPSGTPARASAPCPTGRRPATGGSVRRHAAAGVCLRQATRRSSCRLNFRHNRPPTAMLNRRPNRAYALWGRWCRTIRCGRVR